MIRYIHFLYFILGGQFGVLTTLIFLIDIHGPSNNYDLEILLPIFRILLTI